MTIICIYKIKCHIIDTGYNHNHGLVMKKKNLKKI